MSTPVINFAKAIVSGLYTSADTAITLVTGQGSRLPAVSTGGTPIPAVWFDSAFSDPADDPNKEIVWITNRTTDALTITRAKEGTSASNKNTAGRTYHMLCGLTAALVTELQSISLSQTFRGLRMQTHTDSDKVAAQIRLVHADSIVMSDGQQVNDWNNIDFNIAAATGIGGLDTGSELASTWYKIFAMYNGSTKGLMGQRAKDYKLDTSNTTGEDASQGLRSAVDNSTVKVAQGFQLATAGLVEFVDVALIRTASPVGNFWFTIEANSGGVPSNTPLATSRKMDASRVIGSSKYVRIVFDTPASLSAATQYHLVLQGDYTISATNFISWRMDGSAGTYASGSKALFDSDTSTWTLDTDDDMMFKVYVTENDTPLVVPTGYRYAHIGWAYNDSGSNLKPFFQNDRTINCGFVTSWLMGTVGATTILIDLAATIPPAPVSIEVVGVGSTASNSAIGQLSTTDCAGGTGAFRVGQVNATLAASVVCFPSLSLDSHQGMMVDNNAGSTDYYLSSFYW